jgi:hypothetical protein
MTLEQVEVTLDDHHKGEADKDVRLSKELLKSLTKDKSLRNKKLRRPRIELGSTAWQAVIIPLNHLRFSCQLDKIILCLGNILSWTFSSIYTPQQTLWLPFSEHLLSWLLPDRAESTSFCFLSKKLVSKHELN